MSILDSPKVINRIFFKFYFTNRITHINQFIELETINID